MSEGLVVPETARLGLDVPSRHAAVEATAELLRTDPRVGPWEEFWSSIGPKQIVDLGRSGVCLAHGRSRAVKDLALAASLLASPVEGDPEPVCAVLVFAIPLTMAEEYLRAVGAIARACGEARKREALFAAPSPDALAALLCGWAS